MAKKKASSSNKASKVAKKEKAAQKIERKEIKKNKGKSKDEDSQDLESILLQVIHLRLRLHNSDKCISRCSKNGRSHIK